MLKICLSMRHVKEASSREERDAISHDWIRFLREAGYLPVALPNSYEKAGRYLNSIRPALVILTGGADSRIRNLFEKNLLKEAVKKGIPVFGVCHGMQFINSYFKGHLSKINGGKHVAKRHNVKITAPAWQSIFGKNMAVNSFHDYGILKRGLSKKLKAFAHSDDGLIEGLYHLNLPVAGIMWHPERKDGREDLFKKFMLKIIKRKKFW